MVAEKLLITGASGYLGSHLVNALDLSKYDEVVLLDRNFKADRIKQTGFKIKEVDLMKHFELDLKRFNTVIHCAYLADNEAELKFIIELDKNTHLIFLSSAAVYGENTGKYLDIDSDCKPVNRYGLNKLRLENFIKAAYKNHAILRISNPYGKEYSVRGFYQIAKKKLEQNEFLSINSDKPNQVVRDFIYIDELIKQIKELVEKKASGTFNISSGVGKTLEEFLEEELVSFDSSLIHYKGLNKDEIKNSILKPTL
jgi:UDP-glucose 4-epimerase